MENSLLNIDIVGNNSNQIKRNKVLQLISISLLTLSIILSCKLLIHLLFPSISPQYYEMTIIISSCLAVNIAASLILVKYQTIMEHLETRLELKIDDINNIINNLKIEKEKKWRFASDLRRSEEKYRSLMDNISDGILLLDTEGNFLEANKRMEELLGFSELELLRMNLMQVIPPEESRRAQAALEEIVESGEGNVLNGWIIRKNHQRVPVDFFGSKVDYADRTIIQGIFRDISADRQAANA